MEIDSLLIKAKSAAEVRRLAKLGGEIWQECEERGPKGEFKFAYTLVKIPASVAMRMGLMTPGLELFRTEEEIQKPKISSNQIIEKTPAEEKEDTTQNYENFPLFNEQKT